MAERYLEAPKAELHVHLVGAMQPEFLDGLIDKYGIETALSDALPRHREFFAKHAHLADVLAGRGRAADLYRFRTFEGFLASYFLSTFFLRDPDDLRRLAAAVRARLAEQNIEYAEITLSPAEHLPHAAMTHEALCELMDEAAAAPGPRIRWIVDLVRNLGPQAAADLLDKLLAIRPKSWVGITLGGAEHQFPPAPFAGVYRRAKDAGLRLSVHAGEALGPESVWDAVKLLGAERIGHGVRAVEDPALVEYLAEHRIPLEVCPTGNIRTGVYASEEDHPLARLQRAGVVVTLNTDDPAFFKTSLNNEFELAARQGLSENDLETIRMNAFRCAFD